jgi:DNA-binding transcriptional LysR family regulator
VTDIELRHLVALVTVAEEGTFGRAAARLGYTQSTVSQQIAALEKAVGGAVFDRPGGPRPVRITPLGSVVLTHGRDLLAKAEGLATAVDRFKAGDGRIDIGTFQSVSNVILPQVVRRLRAEHPDCDIRLSEEEPEHPDLGELDLMFYDRRVDGDIEHLKLMDDPYLLVAGRGTFADGPVRLKQLDGAPMVAWPAQDLTRIGAHPRIVFRSASNETLLSMVRAGFGSVLLSELVLRGAGAHADETLSTHELRPAPRPREIFLLWQAGRTHSPLAARAIQIAVDTANAIAT